MPKTTLKSGDTVGVISVTGSAQPERFQKGIQYLEQCGYKARVALNPTKAYGTNEFLFTSETAGNRAKALEALFADDEVKAIITTRGGYGSMEILPLLDFDLLKANPKPLIGYSDVSALLIPLALKAKCPVIHGPSLEFGFSRAMNGEDAAKDSIAQLFAYLSGSSKNPLEGESVTHINGAKKFHGQIVGGNLSIVASLMGTPWQPKLAGKILFLEETGEAPYRAHRFLLQLKLAGMFDDVAGIALGDFTKCTHPKDHGPTIDDVIEDIFKDVSVPVARGLPCGHGSRNLPLPFAEISIDNGKITK